MKQENGYKSMNHKRNYWALPQKIPHISHYFIKTHGQDLTPSSSHEDIDKLFRISISCFVK